MALRNVLEIIKEDSRLIYECAFLSSHVYDTQKPLLKGWSLFLQSTSSIDYAGACYIKNKDAPETIIISHRGTIITNYKDILDEFLVVEKKEPQDITTPRCNIM